MASQGISPHVQKLRHRWKAVRRLHYLATLSYERARMIHSTVLHGKTIIPPPCDRSPAQIIAFLKSFEKLDKCLDEAKLRYEQAVKKFAKSWECIGPDVDHAIVQEL